MIHGLEEELEKARNVRDGKIDMPKDFADLHNFRDPDAPAPAAPPPSVTPIFSPFFHTVMLPWSRSSSMPMRSACSNASCLPAQLWRPGWRSPLYVP